MFLSFFLVWFSICENLLKSLSPVLSLFTILARFRKDKAIHLLQIPWSAWELLFVKYYDISVPR